MGREQDVPQPVAVIIEDGRLALGPRQLLTMEVQPDLGRDIVGDRIVIPSLSRAYSVAAGHRQCGQRRSA